MSDFLYSLHSNDRRDFNGGTANVVPAPSQGRINTDKDIRPKAYRTKARIPNRQRAWGKPYSFTSWTKFRSNTLHLEMEVCGDRVNSTRYPRPESEPVLRAIDRRNRKHR